ncbi:MAG TPA: penicillin-binding protein activator, partial [Gammaproteobacteria bacterium]|nr:penicillin-binding protein activator [Gammaproteobacteria bacterium]
ANLLHVNRKEDREKMQEDNTRASLEQQRRHDFDVIFLLAQPDKAREIVPLLKYYYADNVPIYSTSAIYSGSPAPQKDVDLNGVYFCDIPAVLLGRTGNRLFAVGQDAYLLSNQLPRLAKLPNFPLYGETGALTLTSKQQIYRRLPWTQMHAGHP